MLCRSALSAQSRISATKKSRTGCRSGNRRRASAAFLVSGAGPGAGAALAFLEPQKNISELFHQPPSSVPEIRDRFGCCSQGSPISRNEDIPNAFRTRPGQTVAKKIVDLMARTVKVLANAFDGRGSSSLSTEEFHTTAEVAKTTAVAAARRGMRRPLAVHLKDCASASPEIRISSNTLSAYPAGLPTNDKATPVRNSTRQEVYAFGCRKVHAWSRPTASASAHP